jgi:hypothetical protein
MMLTTLCSRSIWTQTRVNVEEAFNTVRHQRVLHYVGYCLRDGETDDSYFAQLVRNMRANMDFIRQKEEEQNNMLDSPRRGKDDKKGSRRGSRVGVSKPTLGGVKCVLS